MAANMYRVGDYVFFETSSTTPYQIRRIEELNKTQNGNVEAKVMCFYRRRDISSSLIMLADKHQSVFDRDEDDDEEEGSRKGDNDNDDGCSKKSKDSNDATALEMKENSSKEDLDDRQKHQLKHRELFLSRQVETLPATHIRGKCAVTLLNETESLLSYLNKDDTFFYSLVYDPGQKTLLADKGEIRVGSKYQAEAYKVQRVREGEEYSRKSEELETLVFSPDTGLTNKQIDQFLVIARSVGTFARALDCTSTVRQPSLHMSAAAASRDITLFHAMKILHKHRYNISDAIASMVPMSGPVLCRDEMEEWSASEANLFEEALEKYGKDFNDIRQDFLPWKSLKSIVEYYYMWKTTDRYVQQKRIKAAEAESKLKQVYIPNYNKPNPAQIQGQMNGAGGRACESCFTTSSSQWYAWGPVHMQCRLCNMCWSYWKKYGGLKMPTRLDGVRPGPDNRTGQSENVSVSGGMSSQLERLAQMAALQRMHRCTIQGCGKEFRLKAHLARHLATAHGLAIRAGSPRPVMKTRAAFCLITTPLTRISRQVCADILNIQRSARQPFMPINIALIKQECQMRLSTQKTKIRPLQKKIRPNTDNLAIKIGIDVKAATIPLLQHTVPIKEPVVYRFPPRAPEIKTVPSSATPPPIANDLSNGTAMKRGYEQSNGIDGPLAKRPNLGVIRQAGSLKPQQFRGSVISQMNGKMGKPCVMNKGKKVISWMDAPDDVYFVATDATRKLRKQMTSMEFRRAARKPWRNLNVKTALTESTSPVVVLD